MIYFDHAATTMPKPPPVCAAVTSAMNHTGSLGRGTHPASAAAAETAYHCRMLASDFFDIPPERVAFTFNTTHGLNIAIKSLVSSADEVVISGFEHNAVVRPLYALGAKVRIAGKKLFDPDNTVKAFKESVTSKTKAVICTHVSNVFGYILPIKEIADICNASGVPLIIDAAQSAGHLPISVRKLKAAFVAIPGHKGLFGPQGTGLLLCGNMPEPLLYGGTGSVSASPEMPSFLPDIVEAGTQNTHGIAGLAEGLRFVMEKSVDKISRQEDALLKQIEEGIRHCGKARVFYEGGRNQSGVISIIPNEISCEKLGERLYADHVAVRTGYHCSPLAHRSAGTLDSGTLRISVSALTSEEEADMLIQLVIKNL